MTSHNRILLLVGGAALAASLAIAVVFIETSVEGARLQTDELAAHGLQALGDQLVTQVHEQREALGEYLLSADRRPLARYRQAVIDERGTADLIRTGAGNVSGVAEALAAIAAENDTWRATVADPAIAAVKDDSIAGVKAAIQVQIHDLDTSHAATSQFVVQIDVVEAALNDRADALDGLRVQAAGLGGILGLVAAGLTLWFARRDGRRLARDIRSRTNSSAERLAIIASLRALRTQETPEATAAMIAEALHRLPGVDIAAVLELTEDGLRAIVVVGLPGFPIQTGETVHASHSTYLLQRSTDGPWAERYVRPLQLDAYNQALAAFGMKGRAFAPIRLDGELVGLIGLATTDEAHASHLVEDLPAVGEFASVAETILAPALVARRDRAAGRRQIAAAISAAAFRPVFQPIVELATGRTVGFEALTRFDDGSPPDRVFAAAVACGMGIELELVTLEAALRDARLLATDTWLSLNVSPALLAKGGGTLARILSARTAPVVLEVTEHDVIDDYGPLREALVRLGPRVRLAVDDAGAGVANFNHLVELRPSYVKIDIGLVRGVDADPSRRAVVVGLVHFAAESGCEVIAEGIETEAERVTVLELGVTLGQGYLLARPASAATWNVDNAASPIADVERKRDAPRSRVGRAGRTLPLLGALPPIVH